MQNKYKLPNDLKMRCISLVKGYERMRTEYNNAREEIINKYRQASDGQPHGSGIGDESGVKAIKLFELDESPDAQIIRAIEKSRDNIGLDIENDAERQKLTEAIMDSCSKGREFIFNYKNISMGKSTFYRKRSEFLYNIAYELKYIKK